MQLEIQPQSLSLELWKICKMESRKGSKLFATTRDNQRYTFTSEYKCVYKYTM